MSTDRITRNENDNKEKWLKWCPAKIVKRLEHKVLKREHMIGRRGEYLISLLKGLF